MPPFSKNNISDDHLLLLAPPPSVSLKSHLGQLSLTLTNLVTNSENATGMYLSKLKFFFAITS